MATGTLQLDPSGTADDDPTMDQRNDDANIDHHAVMDGILTDDLKNTEMDLTLNDDFFWIWRMVLIESMRLSSLPHHCSLLS